MSPTALTNVYNSLTTFNQPYNLRGNDNIQLPYATRASYKRSFFPDDIHRWNLLYINTKTIQSFESLKQPLEKPKYPKQENSLLWIQMGLCPPCQN